MLVGKNCRLTVPSSCGRIFLLHLQFETGTARLHFPSSQRISGCSSAKIAGLQYHLHVDGSFFYIFNLKRELRGCISHRLKGYLDARRQKLQAYSTIFMWTDLSSTSSI